jgi:hypothetical protein
MGTRRRPWPADLWTAAPQPKSIEYHPVAAAAATVVTPSRRPWAECRQRRSTAVKTRGQDTLTPNHKLVTRGNARRRKTGTTGTTPSELNGCDCQNSKIQYLMRSVGPLPAKFFAFCSCAQSCGVRVSGAKTTSADRLLFNPPARPRHRGRVLHRRQPFDLGVSSRHVQPRTDPAVDPQ